MTGLYLVVAAGHETRNSVGGGCVLWDWVGPVHCGRTSSQSDDIQQGLQGYLELLLVPASCFQTRSSGRCC